MYRYRKWGKLGKRVFQSYEEARSYLRKLIRAKYPYYSGHFHNPTISLYGYSIFKV